MYVNCRYFAMRRRREETQDEAGCSKKRRVEHATFLKWKRDLDHEHQTLSWLKCDSAVKSGKKVVFKLLCKVCTQFEEKIKSRKNFSSTWIAGADMVRISNVRDHARNDQHTHVMSLLKKQRALSSGLGPSSYAPIAQAFAKPSDEEKEKLRAKFDITYLVGVKIFRSRNICTFVSWRLITECRLARFM